MQRLITLALALALAAGAMAREIVVSPGGSAQGDGSRAKPLDLATAVSDKSPAKRGDVILLLPGRYDTGRADSGPYPSTSPAPLIVAVCGEEGKPVLVSAAPGGAAIVNGRVEIKSSYVELVGLEIGDLNWKPTAPVLRAQPTVHAMKSRGVSLVNCNVFGGQGGGVVAPLEAADFRMYGCLVHDFGHLVVAKVPFATEDIQVVQQGMGSGVQTANAEGVKRFEHNILYRGCRGNIDATSTTVGYDFIENISFLSMGLKTNENMDSFPICGNYGKKTPMDRIRVIGNLAYQPIDISAWRPNLRVLSYAGDVVGGAAEVRDNVVMGAAGGLEFTRWKKLTVTGNIVWATQRLVSLSAIKTPDELKGWTVDGNTWINNGASDAFRHGLGAPTFDGWRKLGFDPNGRLAAGRNNRPAGTQVFVFPNKRQAGRAHVGVFNWDALDHVSVDLSKVLKPGAAFRVYNTLDVRGPISAAKPIAEGRYEGGEISLPMKRSPSSPHFEAFLVD